MPRIFLPEMSLGEVQLPPEQSHHLRDVLRLTEGDEIQAFDESGQIAHGIIGNVSRQSVTLKIEKIEPAARPKLRLTVASALPKGPRADWMVEKLSEIGADCFVPLIANRSAVLFCGEGKLGRWNRLAAAAAEQSGRAGVMRIEPATPLLSILQRTAGAPRYYLSTSSQKPRSLVEMTHQLQGDLILFIGPEGGWTGGEIGEFEKAAVEPARLTQAILRIETAAVVSAAIALSA
jgi:16S rRNA (uracil1498-N3)-methyltransferase